MCKKRKSLHSELSYFLFNMRLSFFFFKHVSYLKCALKTDVYHFSSIPSLETIEARNIFKKWKNSTCSAYFWPICFVTGALKLLKKNLGYFVHAARPADFLFKAFRSLFPQSKVDNEERETTCSKAPWDRMKPGSLKRTQPPLQS